MYDLLLLAYQTDLTRVSTFMMAHENSNRTYPQIGVSDPHHPLTHHRGDHTMMAKVKSRSIPSTSKCSVIFGTAMIHPRRRWLLPTRHRADPDGAGMSDGNMHSNENLPVLLVAAGGRIKGGRHLRYQEGTPISNLYLNMLDMVGIPMDQFGDSTGKLSLS